VWDLLSACIDQASTLTPYEYITLTAALEARYEPQKFNCATCIMQYGKSQRLMDKTDRKRQSKGCYGVGVKTYRLDNIKYSMCVGNFNKEIDYIIEAFSLYEKGVLPFKGNLGNQPNKIIEVFNIIFRRRAKEQEKNNG